MILLNIIICMIDIVKFESVTFMHWETAKTSMLCYPLLYMKGIGKALGVHILVNTIIE